jgi:cyclase
LAWLNGFGVGEILLNSIDQDGTGFGFDVSSISAYAGALDIPLIVMGGAGNSSHFKEALAIDGVSSIATANLFNFIGDGLPLARGDLLRGSFNLAEWKYV